MHRKSQATKKIMLFLEYEMIIKQQIIEKLAEIFRYFENICSQFLYTTQKLMYKSEV